MTSEQKKKCNEVIHTASLAAAGVGAGAVAIPVVGSIVQAFDESAIPPIQITMIVSIGKIFETSVSKEMAASILTAMLAAKTGRKIAGLLAGMIPVAGAVINGGTAASITEAIGWAAVKYFDEQKLGLEEK